MRRVNCVLLFFFALLCISAAGMMSAEQDDVKSESVILKTILGSEPTAWTFTGDYSLVTEQGRPALSAKGGISVTGNASHSAPVEFQMTFLLHPDENVSSVTLTVGNADKQSFSSSVSAARGTPYLSYSSTIQPETDKAISGYLYLQAVTERSLSWSEDMRRTLEAQMANAPKLDETLFTLRLAITEKQCSAWLNGRFIGRYAVKKGSEFGGNMAISLTNAALVSVRALPYKDISSRFEPLDLSSFINSSALTKGQRVVKRPADNNAELDGVSFLFPAKDEKGNDHLDIGQSWSRFGALSGYITANYGPFGGRWISADRIDPSRFCMYVPYGQYNALHVIAAADGEKDSVPVLTAQFYRPDAGHPMNFSGRVPLFTAKSGGVNAFPVKLANGRKGKLFHVVIPIDPDKMAWFADLKRVGLELTKEVKHFRAYPDPLENSSHAAGLPSSVHIYAATLEKVGVEVDPQPDATGHVWTAPAAPGYTINLRNNSGKATTAQLTITTTSYDGKDTTKQLRTVVLPASDQTVDVKVAITPTRYGLHYLKVTSEAEGKTSEYTRNFAYLHPDTRERGGWVEGRGPIFGYWAWGGGHDTPDVKTELTVMGQAGAETSLTDFGSFGRKDDEIAALAEKYQMTSHAAFGGGVMYTNSFAFTADKYDPNNPEATAAYLLEELRKEKVEAGPRNIPEYMPIFPEPQIGRITSGIFPHHYNAPDYQWPKEDEEQFQKSLEIFLFSARLVKKEWPDVKILLPYGDPMFTALFLEKSPEARELIDGTAMDLPGFERMPEAQINQVVLNRLYPIMQDIKKYKPDPYTVMVEGTHVPVNDVDTNEEEQANIITRNFLVINGYGINKFESAQAPYHCANYWGENHYGGGLNTRLPKAMPKLAYVSYATLTRHVNRCNFVKYVPTGSTSVYCAQYKHYQTGRPVYILWTIRGKREVDIKVGFNPNVKVYDINDNIIPSDADDAYKEGKVRFTIGQSPVYLEGAPDDIVIELGIPDHSDAAPARVNAKLTNPGSGWTLAAKHDEQYEKTNFLQIERFLGNMSAKTVEAPKEKGGKALAVHLGEQEIDRKVMPYYTSFVPNKAVVIPGKASHLGLWVKASSDWGRVVYSLRDSQGERWLSVGTKDDWNGDDLHAWSFFNFDGWRYVRFELPSSSPYDKYRELGTSWWGSYEGDGIVDLPLKIDKIIVERRASAIYGNDLVKVKPDDVLLGDLYAEYASPADKSKEAIRLSKLRMPVPAGSPTMENPIAEMEKNGVGAPTQVIKVADPAYMYDGTRCHVFFNEVEGAKSYDVWVSPYADGRGAMQLGAGWTEPGKLIEGLHANTDFYIFVVYTDSDGKLSKPSAPLKMRLKNRFAYQ